jgi:Ca2+-binding EF-hand superfamily protein
MIKIQPVAPRWRFMVDRIESAVARDYTAKRDQNANGVVDRSEFQGNSDLFQRIDRDQDDRLEISEIKRYVDLLKQRDSVENPEETIKTAQTSDEQSFSVSSYSYLTDSMKDFFSEEVSILDADDNGLLDTDEFLGTDEEFSAMDQDSNNLVSAREWSEGFVENQTNIQMALKAYRYSSGLFNNSGGILKMTV